jgi:hypothetical protein
VIVAWWSEAEMPPIKEEIDETGGWHKLHIPAAGIELFLCCGDPATFAHAL